MPYPYFNVNAKSELHCQVSCFRQVIRNKIYQQMYSEIESLLFGGIWLSIHSEHKQEYI